MPYVNLAIIMGNCGREPEMRFTPNGNPVTSFSVAVNSYSGSGEERKEYTEWFNVVAWNKLAEVCNQYLRKGDGVYVQGRLQTRSWEKDGQKFSRQELIAEKVQFLGRRGTSDTASTEESAPEDLFQ